MVKAAIFTLGVAVAAVASQDVSLFYQINKDVLELSAEARHRWSSSGRGRGVSLGRLVPVWQDELYALYIACFGGRGLGQCYCVGLTTNCRRLLISYELFVVYVLLVP